MQDQAAFLREKCGGDADFTPARPQNLLQEDREGPIEPELAADRSTTRHSQDLSGGLYPFTRSFDRWELVEWESFIAQLRCGSSEPSR